MPWAVAAAGVAAAGSIGGGLLGASASEKAASQAESAQEQALAFQKQVYGTTLANEAPYLQSGKNALYSIDSLYGLPGAPGTPNTGNGAQQAFQNFTNTPAYTFGLGQGELGANRSLAAQGLTGSGAAAKSLDQYAQGYASQQFGGYVNQLQQLAGMGQNAAALEGSQGQAAANGVGNYLGNIGNIGAAGTLGANNALTGGLGQAAGFLGNSNVQNALSGLGGSSYGNGSNSGAWGGAGESDPESWGS